MQTLAALKFGILSGHGQRFLKMLNLPHYINNSFSELLMKLLHY